MKNGKTTPTTTTEEGRKKKKKKKKRDTTCLQTGFGASDSECDAIERETVNKRVITISCLFSLSFFSVFFF